MSPSGPIYLREGNRLVPLAEAAYMTEDDLQTLIADHPELLSGDSPSDEGPQWLLIRREFGIASEEDGAARWSLDHLFIDRAGVPTLVEVKRSSDTRLRREVVGQMLDYAANAVTYTSVDKLREAFTRTCVERDEDPADTIRGFAGQEVEEFWKTVESNLESRQIRLLFVADVIPPELRAIVEFLNEQLRSVRVLAVEVKQYVSGDRQTVVPRVIGDTQAARAVKTNTAASRSWDGGSWFEAFADRNSALAVDRVRRLLAWADTKSPPLARAYGKSAAATYCYLGYKDDRGYCFPFGIFNGENAFVEVQFGLMASGTYPPFHDTSLRRELARRVEEAVHVSLPVKRLDKYPRFAVEALADDRLDRFIAVFEWGLEQVQEFGLTYAGHRAWHERYRAEASAPAVPGTDDADS